MPSKRSVDIDTLEDFELAEYYMGKVFNHLSE
jgi:CMP-N-acetylneuraminic acid synthetase